MAGQITVKNFSGGMNKDVDFSVVKENQYLDALNYKLIADKDSNSFALENSEGNVEWLDLSGVGGSIDDTYYLVGHCYIQPYLTLFFTTNHADRSPSGGSSVIVRLTVDKDEAQQAVVIYEDGVNSTYLTLSDTYPLSAVGYYEGPDNVKVYWTDGYNPVRVVNIMDDNLSIYEAGMLDLTPDFPMDTTTPVDPRPQIQGLVNGNLDACSVQYGYQYFIKNGSQTMWAPFSVMQVVPVNDDIVNMENYKGGELNEETGYGVELQINVPADNLYDNIRVVAVQYNVLNSIPTVRVIKELSIEAATANTFTFTDTGLSITELLYEDIAVQNNSIYKAKTLEIKDNRLFLGNITEDFFDVDFDARAYRHDIAGVARIYNSNLTDYDTVSKSGVGQTYTFSEVPETHDCINIYNDPDQEDDNQYKFDSNGNWGAEGENITIEFDTNSIVLDTSGVSADRPTNITSAGASSQLYDGDNRSLHRQEVYRMGVVFRNTKLQKSPVKWMCDLKAPAAFEDKNNPILGAYKYSHLQSSGTLTTATLLGVKVTLSNMPPEAASWEVVYVRRGSLDRGVLGQGLIQPSISSNPYRGYWGILGENVAPAPADYDDVCFFESPEISFNKNLKYKDGDYYQKVGTFLSGASNSNDDTAAYSYLHYKYNDFTAEGSDSASTSPDYKRTIAGAQILTYDTDSNSTVTLDSNTVTSYMNDGADIGPTTTILATEPGGPFHSTFIDSAGSTSEIVVANYKRNVFQSQYGGLSYYDRQRNDYIAMSTPRFSDGAITTFEGDTVIDFFHYTRQCIDLPEAILGGSTFGSTHMFPVETSILTRMSSSPYLYRHPSSKKHRLTQEVNGTWEGKIIVASGTAYTHDQELEMYRYNSVYSQVPLATIFLADSTSFDINNVFQTRILASEVKTNNETLDSFTQFKVNNFIDLDGNKGELNNLMLFKNQLFFWQNSGFGVASVNTRSLIQDNNPGVLAVGTGGILDRYDYLSDSIGNQSQFGIAKSRNALYWGDSNKNELFKYDDGLKSESKLKGIQTWINGKGRIGEVKAVFDHKYNDVIFTITFNRVLTCNSVSGDFGSTYTLAPITGLDSGFVDYNVTLNSRWDTTLVNPTHNVMRGIILTSNWDFSSGDNPYGEVGSEYYVSFDQDPTQTYTVTFNEMVDAFVSRNSFTPGRYIELDTNFLSTNDYHDLYNHNDSNASRATYYGTEYDSDLTLVFNKDFPYSKVWDSLKWHSESQDSNDINQFKDTFDKVTIYNDYQHTGDRDLYFKGGAWGANADPTPATRPTELTRRERTWSMAIPRNIVKEDVSSNVDITDSSNWDETLQFKDRIRDKYIVCNFVYDNTYNNVFSVPFISSVYRRSIR